MGVFDPARVVLVDTVGQSLLIRGPVPILPDGSFAYSEIGSKLGVDLSEYAFLDVSLIDCTGEHPMLLRELQAFDLPDQWGVSYWPPYLQPGYDSRKLWGTHLNAGGGRHAASLIWWPIEGLADGQDPSDFVGWPGYIFSGLVSYVQELLEAGPKIALYAHCSLGADRTGALVAGYFVKEKGMSAEIALHAASQTPAGAPSPDYQRLVHAYAPPGAAE